MRDAFGVVADGQTYKNLLYLLVAFPLGFAYSMGLMFGLAFGTILSILLVGIGILLGTVLWARFLTRFERWLANVLLALEIKSADDVRSSPEDGLSVTTQAYLEAPSTWRGLGFLVLKLWVGLLGFILVFLFFSTISLLTAPLHYPYEAELVTINSQPIAWTIETLPEAMVAVPVGVLLAIVALHATNAFATVCGWMAAALLGEPNETAGPSAEPTDEPRPEMPDEWTAKSPDEPTTETADGPKPTDGPTSNRPADRSGQDGANGDQPDDRSER